VEEVVRIVSVLKVTGERVDVTSTLQVVSRDPDDNIIINTAFDGNADYIVSGDKDVKEVKNFKGIKIVSVDEMLKIL
jgi:putative PIN family toxin of toxin-antitoxin system